MSYISNALAQLNARYTEITDLISDKYYFSDEPGNDLDGNNFGIADGGADMYDDANFIDTNLTQTYDFIVAGGEGGASETAGVPITHTPAGGKGSNDYTNPPMDGVVRDGSTYFGSGSEYFTNMYPAFWVMIADNININEFTIWGDNGADGSGDLSVNQFSVTVSGVQHTVYQKTIYNADDPTINHLIIVQGDGSGISHRYSEDTNEDLDNLTGISSQNVIYYLLLSKDFDLPVDSNVAASVAEKFLEIVKVKSAQEPAYPLPKYRFRVNLIDRSKILSSPLPDSLEHILLNLESTTVYIPYVQTPLKHGDEFTLYGSQAIRVYELYINKEPKVLELI